VTAKRDEIPPPSVTVFEAEVEQLRRDLRLFLKLEAARDAEPVALEVPFGFGETDPEEPLSKAEPVLISIGGDTIRLRGRIDRIDRLPDGTYEVTDYKTGRIYRDNFKTDFGKGVVLQHALYAETARQMLGPVAQVSASSYWFCTERSWGERVTKSATLDVKVPLRHLAEAISAGAFLRGGDEAGCRFCDYRHACSPQEVAASERKQGADHAGLEALRRLRNDG
jgi:hypothetical protein